MEHLMTSEEVAEYLHVDPVTIRRLVNKSELSAYRIGADYRFAPSDLQDYLQRQRISALAQNESGTNPNHPLDQLTQLFGKVIQGKHTTPSELLNRFDRFTTAAPAQEAQPAQRIDENVGQWKIGPEHDPAHQAAAPRRQTQVHAPYRAVLHHPQVRVRAGARALVARGDLPGVGVSGARAVPA